MTINSLEYLTEAGSHFRFFSVEADRATVPATSANWNRKSFERNLLQYHTYVADGGYRGHLRLTAPLLVLTVSSDPARTARMIDFTARHYPVGINYMLFQTWEDFCAPFRPPLAKHRLLSELWYRGGCPSIGIDGV